MVGWLDELLIKMMKSLAQYRKGDPASVVPPPPLAQLPQLIFHLRRSGVLRVAGFSPDRTAAFRLLASSLSVFSTLVLIQPTLTGLEPGRPPAPLPLTPPRSRRRARCSSTPSSRWCSATAPTSPRG